MTIPIQRQNADGSPTHPWPCPYCQANINASTSTLDSEDTRPTVGDLSICVSCGGLLKFDDLLLPVKLNQWEVEQLLPCEREYLLSAQKFILDNLK